MHKRFLAILALVAFLPSAAAAVETGGKVPSGSMPAAPAPGAFGRSLTPEMAQALQANPSLMPASPPVIPAKEEPAGLPKAPATKEPEMPSLAEQFFNRKEGPVTADGQGVTSGADFIKKKVAASATNLEQFGYGFFDRRDGFEPDPQALVGPDYVIGPGDTLRIDVWGNIEGNYAVMVDRNGEITVPRVGVINLWGQSFAQAKETIRRQIGKYFKNFEFNLTMGALRSIQVYLVGEVATPGTYQVSSLSTVLTSLSAAGGPAKTGSLRNVQLVRGGKTVASIDFYDFFLRGDKSSDVRLQAGDTVFVPVTGPLVGVSGNVRRPAIYELKGGETLKQVLELASGVIPTAYLQKVQLERVEAHQQKTVLDLDLTAAAETAAAMDLLLQDRDLVQVAPIALAKGLVRLEGYVVREGDYRLTEGMRVADLILPYDNLLPEFFPGAAQIVRLSPPEFRPEILTIHLHKALEGDPAHNLLLQEYDTVKLFSREQMEEIPEVLVSGAVLRPGAYRLLDHMTVKDLVSSAGNLKRRAYLGEAEITRYIPEGKETRTERILVSLDKALAGDPAHNRPLQTDDHLFIRSIPEFGERLTVTVKGEVLFPGTYAIAKGESLSSVLARAGGFTSQAYLRGAVFTRESLKEMQRQRLNLLIFEQEQEANRLAAEIAQGAMSEEDLKASQAMLQSRMTMLEKLKQAPVNGRMIVRLEPLSKFKGGSSDIEVFDGDTISIPQDPQSVSVLGHVYNPVSLAYEGGKTLGYYLDRVGGPKKDAETSEMFIVRADGTVQSKQQGGWGLRWDSDGNRWIAGGFNATVLYPGDTILVPEKVEKTAWMKDLKDISQIFFQLALGAAAISSF